MIEANGIPLADRMGRRRYEQRDGEQCEEGKLENWRKKRTLTEWQSRATQQEHKCRRRVMAGQIGERQKDETEKDGTEICVFVRLAAYCSTTAQDNFMTAFSILWKVICRQDGH